MIGFAGGVIIGHTRLGRILLWTSALMLVILLLMFGREILFDLAWCEQLALA